MATPLRAIPGRTLRKVSLAFTPRRCASLDVQRATFSSRDHPLLDLSRLPVEIRQSLHLQDDDFVLYPAFANVPEQNAVSSEALATMDRILATPRAMARKRKLGTVQRDEAGFLPAEGYVFDKSHFDGVIDNYRECSISNAVFSEAATCVLRRIYNLFDSPSHKADASDLLVHLLHLAPDGAIYPHVDNVEASADTRISFEALLPPGSVYVQKGAIRYNFEHEIPRFARFNRQGEAVGGEQRLSIMVRDRLASASYGHENS